MPDHDCDTEPAVAKYCEAVHPLYPHLSCDRVHNHNPRELANNLLMHVAWDVRANYGQGATRRWSTRPPEQA